MAERGPSPLEVEQHWSMDMVLTVQDDLDWAADYEQWRRGPTMPPPPVVQKGPTG